MWENRKRTAPARSKTLAGGLALFLAAAGAAGAASVETKLEPIVVRPGDTLWSISQKYLKDPTRWNDILKYNELPTSDPTVALPGMTLRVPTQLIKEQFRAATLLEAVRRVYARKKGTPKWDDVDKGALLYHEDGLRTRQESWARVQFHEGSILSVDPDSMVILKSPKKADHELFLNRGSVHATTARVATPSALIVPKGKDTKYTAKVLNDLSTSVKVYKGQAEVQDIKGLKKVTVNAGQATQVSLEGLPEIPVRIPDMNTDLDANIALGNIRAPSAVSVRGGDLPEGRAPAAGDAAQLEVDLKKLTIGMPVAAFHVQIARDRGFRRVVFDKTFDAYENINLRAAGLGDGSYWARIAIIDLLGDEGAFSEPRPYRVGAGGSGVAAEEPESSTRLFVDRPPQERTTVRSRRYRIRGRAEADLTVSINGERVPKDEDGNFSLQVLLEKGANDFRISAVDLRGNDHALRRTIILQE